MAGALERSGFGECTALIDYLRGRGVIETNLRKMTDDKVFVIRCEIYYGLPPEKGLTKAWRS